MWQFLNVDALRRWPAGYLLGHQPLDILQPLLDALLLPLRKIDTPCQRVHEFDSDMTFDRLVWRGSDNGSSDHEWPGNFACDAFPVVAHISFHKGRLLGGVFLWLKKTSKPLSRDSLGNRSNRTVLRRSTQ